MVKIAVDGMGGDFAPHAIVKGAELAYREGLADIVLLGNKDVIGPLIDKSSGIEIVHTTDNVDMDESPSVALRKKRNSSMNKAFALLKENRVQGVVTAGNSGAAMAFAIFTLGRFQLVERPAIATLNPNAKGGKFILLDAGGNVDCKPGHLAQFAVMGDAFARSTLGIGAPRIGILSNASEIKKGNDLTGEAHVIVKGLGLNYVGYVEGMDMYKGNVDVVVTDGFVGNVALKVSEGVAEILMTFFKENIEKGIKSRIGYLFLKEVFDDLRCRIDFSEYGGAPLLGVDGVCVICHGRSDEKTIKNAVGMAKCFVEKGLNDSIKEKMQNFQLLQRIKEK